MNFWAILQIRELFGINELRRESWPTDKIYKINISPLEPIPFLTDEDLCANDWTLVFNNNKKESV